MEFALIALIIVSLLLACVIGALLLYIYQGISSKKRIKKYASGLERLVEKQSDQLNRDALTIQTVTKERDDAHKMLEVVTPLVPVTDNTKEPEEPKPEYVKPELVKVENE